MTINKSNNARKNELICADCGQYKSECKCGKSCSVEQEKVEQDTIYIMAQFIAEATTRGAVSSRQLAKEMYYAGYRLSPTLPSELLLEKNGYFKLDKWEQSIIYSARRSVIEKDSQDRGQ